MTLMGLSFPWMYRTIAPRMVPPRPKCPLPTATPRAERLGVLAPRRRWTLAIRSRLASIRLTCTRRRRTTALSNRLMRARPRRVRAILQRSTLVRSPLSSAAIPARLKRRRSILPKKWQMALPPSATMPTTPLPIASTWWQRSALPPCPRACVL